MPGDINKRGLGRIFQPSYKDKRTGKSKKSQVWWIEYWFRGKQFRENSHSKKRADALKLLNRRIGEMGMGKLTTPDSEKVTFEDLAKMLLDDYSLNSRKSVDRAKRGIFHLRAYFALYRAVEITSDGITRYALKRREEGGAKPATIRYELALLKHAFKLAIRADRLLHAPHFPTIEVRNTRTGFFEEAEFLSVREHLDADLSAAVTAAYCTGWRIKSEILPLQWPQIDFKSETVRLEPGTTKNDEGRLFPFGNFPMLKEVILEQRTRTDVLQQAMGRIIPWVFHREGKPIKDFRKQWQDACKKAGVPGRLLHDFRRTAVRNLERAGVPRSVAMKLVGHKTESIYLRYAIVSESDLAEGVAKLAAIQNAQGLESKKVVDINSRKVPAK